MLTKCKPILAVMLLILLVGLADISYAGLKQVGPVDPVNGFPIWYQDTVNESLQLCLDGDGITGPCIFDPVDPTNPFSVLTGFGAEAFYTIGSATINAGVTATLVIALEAAYRNGDPAAGDQIVFGRIRIRTGNLPVDGIYTVIHPFGTQQFNVVLDQAQRVARQINFTQDIGIGKPGDFTGALSSGLGPFLRWTAPDYPYVDPATGDSYVGNPLVRHAVTGSPLGTNYFQIIGPPGAVLDPDTGGNVVTETLFSLSGKLATLAGVAVDRAVYSMDPASQGFVDVYAFSSPGQQISVSGVGAVPVTMVEQSGTGRYFARIPFDGALAPRPSSITATNLTDVPNTVVTAPVKDAVTISSAVFDAATTTLTINATSSDRSATPPVLTAVGFPGAFAGGKKIISPIAGPPLNVTVRSSAGGEHVEPVLYAMSGHAPVITSTPVTIAPIARLYSYLVTAAEIDAGELLTYSFDPLLPPPTGMAINSKTGLITWRPTDLQVGDYPLTVVVADPTGLSATQSFTVSVRLNNPPVITSTPITSAWAGITYRYRVTATDPEGLALTYSLDPAQPAPTGMTINSLTGMISWIPTAAQVGDAPVSVLVTDAGGLFASQSFTIAVAIDTRPVITSTPRTIATLGRMYTYQVVATDPDAGDVLTYSLGGTPPIGMSIDQATGLLTWAPSAGQEGVFAIRVVVRDSRGLTATQNFNITVELLAVTRAQYTTNGSRWNIDGNGTFGADVTVRLGTATGPVIGTATIGANGTWSLAVINSPVVPGTIRRISVTSSRGSVIRVPFIVR